VMLCDCDYSSIHVTHSYVCDMAHSHVSHGEFICMCHTVNSCVDFGAFMCVTR